MKKDNPLTKSISLVQPESLNLPNLSKSQSLMLNKGNTVSVEGTNVVRVPFGIRQPLKKRPNRPERYVTLVLPFQPLDNPTPPPQAA